MNKRASYLELLKGMPDPVPFLLQESGLPGPRGNLELAGAVADMGSPDLFERLLGNAPDTAPTNDPREFLHFCGVLGLGRLLSEGQQDLLPRLRDFASDPRWRTREAVAMALQRLGDRDMDLLLETAEEWACGTCLERRAAMAAVCEPRLLRHTEHAGRAADLLDGMTASISRETDRKSEPFRVLRQALGYGWSVLAAAAPAIGRPCLEHWAWSSDPDVRWIVRENLKKNRLRRIDPGWAEELLARLEAAQ